MFLKYLLFIIVTFSLTNLLSGQISNSKLFYCKNGTISQTHYLLAIGGHKDKITIISTAGLSAYNILVNSEILKTDTTIKGIHVDYKSINGSVYIIASKDKFYMLTENLKQIKLSMTDIESNKLKQLWTLFPSLDKLIGY